MLRCQNSYFTNRAWNRIYGRNKSIGTPPYGYHTFVLTNVLGLSHFWKWLATWLPSINLALFTDKQYGREKEKIENRIQSITQVMATTTTTTYLKSRNVVNRDIFRLVWDLMARRHETCYVVGVFVDTKKTSFLLLLFPFRSFSSGTLLRLLVWSVHQCSSSFIFLLVDRTTISQTGI